jgi:hypothetical protein
MGDGYTLFNKATGKVWARGLIWNATCNALAPPGWKQPTNYEDDAALPDEHFALLERKARKAGWAAAYKT